jgi:hypothetical protein
MEHADTNTKVKVIAEEHLDRGIKYKIISNKNLYKPFALTQIISAFTHAVYLFVSCDCHNKCQ